MNTRLAPLLVAALVATCSATVNAQETDACATRMKQVFSLLRQYSQFHAGQLPDALSALYYGAYTDEIGLFACPDSGNALTQRTDIDRLGDYRLVARELSGDRRVAVLTETADRHGGKHHVLYGDGTVVLEGGGGAPTQPPAEEGTQRATGSSPGPGSRTVGQGPAPGGTGGVGGITITRVERTGKPGATAGEQRTVTTVPAPDGTRHDVRIEVTTKLPGGGPAVPPTSGGTVAVPPTAGGASQVVSRAPVAGVGLQLGIEVKLQRGEVIITTVKPQSLAGFMHLQPGDKIVRIDGKGLDERTFPALLTLLQGKPGPAVTLEVVRQAGGEHVTVTVPGR